MNYDTVVVLTVVEHLPGDLGCPTDLPLHTCVHWWERGPVGAMMRELGRGIVAGLSAFLEKRRATSEATGVRGWGGAWRPPWVVLIDVVDRARCGVAVY